MSSLTDPAEPAHSSLGERLHRAGRLMRHRLADELASAGHDYPIDFWPTLKLVARRGRVHQEEIAEFLVRDKATATRLLGRMEGAGLVERYRDPANRRRKHVTLTAAGRTVHRELLACAASVHRAAVRGIRPDQLAACAQVLEQVYDNLDPKHAPHSTETPARHATTPPTATL